MTFDTQRGEIWEALINRVRAMTIAGGYHYDVKSTSVQAEPINILLVAPNELPFFLVELSTGGTRDFHAAGQVEIVTRFVITGRADSPGTDPLRKVKAGENLLGDLERVLEADLTLGGKVFDLRMLEPDGPLVGLGADNRSVVLAEVEAHWHREYGLP